MMERIYVLLLGITILLGGCDSMEESFEQFSDRIHYVGKCSELTVTPGWEKVDLAWKNGIDPSRNKIKITWISNNGANQMDTLLPGDSMSCQIKNLENENYTFTVYGVDSAGNCSLPETNYGRPYTYEHEALVGFSTVVIKSFRVKDNVLLFFDSWSASLKEVKLQYYQGGEKQEMVLNKEILNKKYLLIEGVDDAEVVVLRTGTLEGCPDEIVFQPYELDFNTRNFGNDFASQVKDRYQVNDIITDEFVNSLTELELDRDIQSLEDILFFPNLKKLKLGKNRYMDANYLVSVSNPKKSLLEEKELSMYILELANRINGLTVECYNEHYFSNGEISGKSFMLPKDNPTLPDLNYLSTENWNITVAVKDETGYNSHMEYLLDNDATTIWRPRLSTSFVMLHELTIDMKEQKTFSGFKVAQKAFVNENDGDATYLPNSIKIMTSSNNVSWDVPFIAEDVVIGNTPGEVNLLRLKEPKTARYIRIKLSDISNYGMFNVLLGDFIPFE